MKLHFQHFFQSTDNDTIKKNVLILKELIEQITYLLEILLLLANFGISSSSSVLSSRSKFDSLKEQLRLTFWGRAGNSLSELSSVELELLWREQSSLELLENAIQLSTDLGLEFVILEIGGESAKHGILVNNIISTCNQLINLPKNTVSSLIGTKLPVFITLLEPRAAASPNPLWSVSWLTSSPELNPLKSAGCT